jgi:hypothetical protein
VALLRGLVQREQCVDEARSHDTNDERARLIHVTYHSPHSPTEKVCLLIGCTSQQADELIAARRVKQRTDDGAPDG